MKIIISNYETGEIYETLDDVTATQMTAYGCSDIVAIDDEEYVIKSKVTDFNRQEFTLMVSN